MLPQGQIALGGDFGNGKGGRGIAIGGGQFGQGIERGCIGQAVSKIIDE